MALAQGDESPKAFFNLSQIFIDKLPAVETHEESEEKPMNNLRRNP